MGLAAWLAVLALFGAFHLTIPHVGFTVYVPIIGWMAYELHAHDVDMRDFIQPIPTREFRRLWLVVPLLMLALGLGTLLLLLLHISPEALRRLADDETRGHSVGNVLFLGLVTALIGPVTEELLFRGVLLQRWTRKWGFRRAAIASSAVFAIGHLDPIAAFVFALVMVHFYTLTGSLRLPIAAHVLNNGFVFVSSAFNTHGATAPADDLAALRRAWPSLLILVVIAAALLIAYFRRVPPFSSWMLPRVGRRADATPAQ